MYAKFYGFQKLPFQLTPDPFFFFESAEHRKAMAHLTYGLHNAEGFIIITGEVGAGKTTIVDCLLSQIDPKCFVAAKIVTSQLEGDDLLRMICSAFGLNHMGWSKASVLEHLQQFAVAQLRSGRRALLIIDEAQNLTFDALEELRMLSNITVGTSTALQSFLLGQPQLRQLLGNPRLEQLRQRITAAYHLGALSEADTQGYVEHRLRRAGWAGDPEFTGDSFSAIYRHSAGVPRRINNLCSRVLLLGMLEDKHQISGATIAEVASEIQSELSAVTRPKNGADQPAFAAHAGAEAVLERLDNLDSVTAVHDHAIRRLIDLVGRYVN